MNEFEYRRLARLPARSSGWLPTFLLALAATAVAGCSGKPLGEILMMPAPAAYEAAPAPFGDDETADGLAVLDMLYATNRAPSMTADDDPYYSGERGYLVRVGAAEIEFGDSDLTWDKAREISLLKNRPGEFPLRVDSVREYGVIPNSVSVFTPYESAPEVYRSEATNFAAAINARLDRTPQKDVFIYVHGFKVEFENPLLVASEMWHFLGYEGAFIAFSWPATPGMLSYFKDVETARVSSWGLRKLLQFIARETRAERIHIVGYSAGTRVVLNALHEIALENAGVSAAEVRASTRLGNVVLVGSDVDTGLFASHILDGLLNAQQRLTLYTSSEDKALRVAERVFSHRRMGEVQPGTLDARMRDYVERHPELALVDIGGASDILKGHGHAYFRQSPWVSSDVLMTLRYDLPPGERGLVQTAESPFWQFPPDYLQRFESALEQANPALRGPALESSSVSSVLDVRE